jgi:Putative neutral zinc metallopeptidase
MLRDRGQSRPPASRPIRFSTLVASRRPSDDCRAGAAGLFHFAGGHQADVPACFHEQRFASPYGDDSSAADKVRNVRQHFCEDKIWSFLQILLGHHVQNLLGVLPKAQQAQRAMDKAEANSLQVRVELQADCLAGVWANRGHAKWDFIEPGDVDSALQTASAIGDDRLQRQSQGYVVPDAFTHGTSAQRSRWFTTGLKSGDVASCDTFRNEQL